MAEEIRVRRRKLPHWELSGSVYFITFTTTDEGNLSEPAKEIVFESIKFHAGNKYDLHACVVMQTHAHIILSHRAQARTPMLPVGTGDLNQSVDSRFRLAEIMHGIKSYSSHRINQTMQRKGKVWLAESYDRGVRDEKEELGKTELHPQQSCESRTR